MRKLLIAAVAVAAMWSGPAAAQLTDAVGSVDHAAIVRELAPQPEQYTINSAIVLTNPHGVASDFKIELFDHNGVPAGGGSVTVGPRALEVVWVSRLLTEQGSRFIGWGIAKSERPMQCNAFLAGVGFSPLPVEEQRVRTSTDVVVRHKLFSVLAAL